MIEKSYDDHNNKMLDLIFRKARTYSHWQDKEVSESILHQIYNLMKMGPTSANCCPLRIVFITSAEGKARLKPHLDPGNVDKTMAAPVTAILAQDLTFYEKLPILFPHVDARSWFVGNEAKIRETAFRNSSLQGAYFIVAARALGLDCGPMSGFNGESLDQEFFPDGKIKSNFLCNLGYGDDSKLYPRDPRLTFEDVCQVI